jgi:hypothetical protein
MKWFTLARVWWRLRQGKSGHVAFIHKHTKRWTVLHYGPDGLMEASWAAFDLKADTMRLLHGGYLQGPFPAHVPPQEEK